MVGPLESFMKSMMTEDTSVKLVVDNARVFTRERKHKRRNLPPSGPFSDTSDNDIEHGRVVRPVCAMNSKGRDKSLDVSDHTRRETRWDSTHLSPKSYDQISPPTRVLTRAPCVAPFLSS